LVCGSCCTEFDSNNEFVMEQYEYYVTFAR